MPNAIWVVISVAILLYLFFGNPMRFRFGTPPKRNLRELSSKHPVTISGRVSAAEKVLTAPLSGRRCVAWSLRIQRADDLDDQTLSTQWETIEEESDKTDFLIEDETGRALVRMEVVEMDLATTTSGMTSLLGALPEERQRWLASRIHPELTDDALGFRLVERLLAEGEQVSVIGVGREGTDSLPVIEHPEDGALKVSALANRSSRLS